MSKNFLFNMGYDTTHVTSVLASEGVEDGSRVILVTPGNRNQRQDNSIADVRNYLDSLSIEVDLEVFEAGTSFEKDFENFASLFSRIDNIVLSLSGGPRDFLVPLTMASTVVSSNIEKTYLRSDIDSELQKLDMPDIGFDLDKVEIAILNEASKDSLSVKEFEDVLDVSESTIYRKLEGLEERGLVVSEQDGESVYSASSLGCAVVFSGG